jgi:hypothetical protein
MDSEVREWALERRREAEERAREYEQADAEEPVEEPEEEPTEAHVEKPVEEREQEQTEPQRPEERKPKPEQTSAPTPPSKPSGGRDAFDAICDFLGRWLGVVLYYILRMAAWVFILFALTTPISSTWIIFVSALLVFLGLLPLAIPIGLLVILLQIAFLPYWFGVFVCVLKKRLTMKQVLGLFVQYFLKGPFAYPKLAQVLVYEDIMPGLARWLYSAADWIKGIFKKKK